MKKLIIMLPLLFLLFISPAGIAQDVDTSVAEPAPADISGEWVTQSGNLVDVSVSGMDVNLYFPAYARTMTATWDGSVLVYITHYRDPSSEEVYIDVPDSELRACRGFVRVDDPRHRFILTLSGDGMVLSGVKEISVLHCDWDTDESGNTFNHRPSGTEWRYFSDYQWRRSNCDFSDLPALNGNILEKYELLETLISRFGLLSEFSFQDFDITKRIKFNYSQGYIETDTGIFVPASEVSSHRHTEKLDSRTYFDAESGMYIGELFPYASESYINLLSALTILLHQLKALEDSGENLTAPTTQMELDSINYAWSHRQVICAIDNDEFSRHIDIVSRALEFRALAED